MARQYTKRTKKQTALSMQTDCTGLYVRVSTDKQAEEGFSLEAQRERLRGMCVANGWRICDEHLYVDEGESAKSTARPAYQRMLTAIADGAVNRIVVTKLDRLSRNTRDFLELLDYCNGQECAIVSIAESFDTGTPTGRAVVTVLMAFAELERQQITERVMTGKRTKAQSGGFNGAAAPYGYRYNGESFDVDADRAEVVRGIFGDFLKGETMQAIAERLNRQAIPTARGGTWATSTVRYILRNGAYAGLTQWDGVEQSGGAIYPPIVTKDTYESAHRRLAALKPGKMGTRQNVM